MADFSFITSDILKLTLIETIPDVKSRDRAYFLAIWLCQQFEGENMLAALIRFNNNGFKPTLKEIMEG